jgi:hypothetical protein
MDVQLRNLIAKNNIIAPELCDSIVEKSKKWEWQTHEWYSHHEVQSYSHKQKELDVVYGANIPDIVQQQLIMHISEVWKAYMMLLPELLQHQQGTNLYQGQEAVKANPFNMIKFWSSIRLNRYSEGTMMRPHFDHIQSLFDGEKRGIPVLSVIGALNDHSDYEGGGLVFWDDFEIKLDKGDILIFPSCYLYPHRVQEVTKGERYSFVCWGF